MSIFPHQPVSYVLAATLIGLAGGWAFHRLWSAVLSRGGPVRLWAGMPEQLRAMLASDEAAVMLHHYRVLLTGIGRYAALNLLAVLVGIAPITLMWLAFDRIVEAGPVSSPDLDTNPLRSYLGDLDLCLFVSATAGSLLSALWARSAQERRP